MGEISRRVFLKLTGYGGIGAVAAGLGAKSADKLIPYVIPPEDGIRPGVWTTYATTCRECPAGCGMHVRCTNGRAVKCEGNPDHPINRGGLCARGQAALQGLYDPDRVKGPLANPGGRAGADPRTRWQAITWAAAIEQVAARLKESSRVVLISDLQTGSLAQLMGVFSASRPGGGGYYTYEAFNYEALREAHGQVFGLWGIPMYRLDRAELIVSFAADFLETWISPVQFARDFTDSHSHREGRHGRFVYVGPRFSMTAGNADEFIQVRPGDELAVAEGLLKALLDSLPQSNRLLEAGAWLPPGAGRLPPGVNEDRIKRLAKSFISAKGSVALAGPTGATGPLATRLASVCAVLNFVAGRYDPGGTVDFSRNHALGSGPARTEQVSAALAGLGPDDTAIIHNTNPAFTIPGADEALSKAGAVVYMGTMLDETAQLARWVLPIDSPLESWGDYDPYYGYHGIIQPTMKRLYDTRLSGDILLALAETAGGPLNYPAGQSYEGGFFGVPLKTIKPAYRKVTCFADWLYDRWLDRWESDQPLLTSAPDAAELWKSAQRKGIYVPGASPAFPELKVHPPNSGTDSGIVPPSGTVPSGNQQLGTVPNSGTVPKNVPANEVDLWVWPSIFLYDGRHANRGWLQEAPDPTTTCTWNTWVDVHPTQAAQLGLSDGDEVAITPAPVSGTVQFSGTVPTSLEKPWTVPNSGTVPGSAEVLAVVRVAKIVLPDNPSTTAVDIAEGTVGIALGQGHTSMGMLADGRGGNAFRLLGHGGNGGGMFGKVVLRKTGRRRELSYGSFTQAQHDRDIIQWVKLSELKKMKPGDGDQLILPLPEGYRKDKDLYKAHNYPEHRWAMAVDLHRCIGCGACAVACYAENNLAVVGEQDILRSRTMAWLRVVPYRDQRDAGRVGWLPMLCQHCDTGPCEPVCPVFASVHNDEGLNAQVYNRCVGTRYCSHNCPYKVRRFNWSNIVWRKPLTWQLNPEVTVRERGVMEKCTFCIQRIRQAEIKARLEGRKVRDGEVQTACAQSCPTRAIIFGDLMDLDSEVSRITGGRDGLPGDPRRYHVLAHLNTKPAITYLRRIVNDEAPDGNV
ncbi:MAG: 4Fe-4S dicluster domain-containing protein [Phycisphaerae bacterium]